MISIDTFIEEFSNSLAEGEAALLAGAGVSCEAGLPSWEDALATLADLVDAEGDSAIAEVMRDRIAKNQYLDAAEFYTRSDLTPQRRRESLVDLFSQSDGPTSRTNRLVSLPFRLYATTNYDTLLEESFDLQHHERLTVYENTADHFRAVRNQFPAAIHIHGTVDNPPSIVFSESDYAQLDKRAYEDFLRYLLRDLSVVFIGFSFADPSLRVVLRFLNEEVGFPGAANSYALLPKSASDDFDTLTSCNIEIVPYDDDEGHNEMWSIVKTLAEQVHEVDTDTFTDTPDREIERVRSNMAASYAYFSIHSKDETAVNTIYAGLVYAAINDLAEDGTCSVESVRSQVRDTLGVGADHAKQITSNGLRLLGEQEYIEIDGTDVLLEEQLPGRLDDDIFSLVDALKSRAYVKEHANLPEDIEIGAFLLHTLITNGMKLAYGVLRERPVYGDHLRTTLEEAYDEILTQGRPWWRIPLINAAEDLITSPTATEEERLSRISRLAFLTETVLGTPTLETITGSPTISRVYLDANVIMPAIVPYHARNQLYGQALRSLRKRGTELAVSMGFLNEVVSHRRIAVEGYELAELDDPNRLKQYARFYGHDFGNVFLGAFTAARQSGENIRFDEFLRKYASYTTEEELAEALHEQGFKIEDLEEGKNFGAGMIPRWFTTLKDQYERDYRERQKDDPLIWHEARQIELVRALNEFDRPAWFVTNDRRLVGAVERIAQGETWVDTSILQRLLSPSNLVAYTDLSAERSLDWRNYLMLLASPGHRELETQIDRFITDMIVKDYGAALAVETTTLVNELKKRLSDENALPESRERLDDLAWFGRFLDTFEEEGLYQELETKMRAIEAGTD